MSDCQSCACPCHVPLAQRLEAIGLSLDSLTPTELALVDALLPPGEWRSAERLCAAAGWTVGNTRKALRSNLHRLRPVLHVAGWDVVVAYGAGCYRVQRCGAPSGAPGCATPLFVTTPPALCIQCGGPRTPRRHNLPGRCEACLTAWRSRQPRHKDVPRCELCSAFLHSRNSTLCKACLVQTGGTIRLCADCPSRISKAAERCPSCAARESNLRRARVLVAV